VGLSEAEKQFLKGGIEHNLRSDGRTRLQFRSISVETGVIPQVCIYLYFTDSFEYAKICLVILYIEFFVARLMDQLELGLEKLKSLQASRHYFFGGLTFVNFHLL
jgi:hypothetical protein